LCKSTETHNQQSFTEISVDHSLLLNILYIYETIDWISTCRVFSDWICAFFTALWKSDFECLNQKENYWILVYNYNFKFRVYINKLQAKIKPYISQPNIQYFRTKYVHNIHQLILPCSKMLDLNWVDFLRPAALHFIRLNILPQAWQLIAQEPCWLTPSRLDCPLPNTQLT